MVPLSANQEILFTRQRHEAERMGLHWDYRLVAGDKAYSWATKKEMPEAGSSIVLFEQPVHDSTYALSPKVVIPTGSYGAGVTTLDWVRKAQIGAHSTGEQFTIHTKDGQKFLLKKLDNNKYGEKAWLFRNLGDSGNRYIEKAASLVGGALITHLAQNAGTAAALKNKHVAKYLANSFAQGAKGVMDKSLKSKAGRAVLGAGLPDIAVAHKTMHDLGHSMKGILEHASNKQKVGLRMLTEGRFSDLKKHGLHKDQLIQKAHEHLSKHLGLPKLEHLVEKSDKIEHLWKDKSHPLLSNISKHISRGKVGEGKHIVPGKLTAKPVIGGALASFAVDPAAGTLNTAKSLMSSKKVTENKYGKKVVDMLHNQFIKHPIEAGIKAKGKISELKNKAYKFGVNPLSANLKRTSSALTDALKD